MPITLIGIYRCKFIFTSPVVTVTQDQYNASNIDHCSICITVTQDQYNERMQYIVREEETISCQFEQIQLRFSLFLDIPFKHSRVA